MMQEYSTLMLLSIAMATVGVAVEEKELQLMWDNEAVVVLDRGKLLAKFLPVESGMSISGSRSLR